MNISHRQLQAFVHVAQSNTFAEAAEKMHLSQPALSLAIKKMEGQLGGNLFSRSTRTVRLSPEGQAFLPTALRLLEDWEVALDDICNLFTMNRGNLTVAAMPSFASSLLPSLLRGFHQNWKNINITVLDVVMETTIQQVLDGRAELGFTFEHEQFEGLEFSPMFTDNFIVILPLSHPLSGNTSVSWRDLIDYPFVAMNRGSSIRRWIEEYCQAQGIELNVVAQAGQLSTLGQFVNYGLGMSIVPGICQQQMRLSGLKCLPLKGGEICKPVGVIKSKRGNLSVPARALWDMATAFQWDQLTSN